MSNIDLVQLGDLYALKAPSVNPALFPDEIFDLFSVPAYDVQRPSVVAGSEIGSTKIVVEPNDVLICRIVPHIRRAWKVPPLRGRRQIASGEWIVLRDDRVFPNYLRHYLLSERFHRQFMTTVAGVGGSLLRARPAQAASIPVPIPPVSEQRRIAEILDRADEVRAKRRRALVLLNELLDSTFIDMFGDPALNPHGWLSRGVGTLASKYSDGPFGSNLKSSDYVSGGVRVIRLQNIGVGDFVDKDRAYVSAEHFSRLYKHECVPGDVLIGTMGDPNLRACLQPEDIPVALNKADCVQLRPDRTVSTGEWLVGLLNQPSVARMAQSLIMGQTRARISMGRLRGLQVPVPPLELQEQYSQRVKEIRSLKTEQIAHLAKLDELFLSMQQRAFAGSL